MKPRPRVAWERAFWGQGQVLRNAHDDRIVRPLLAVLLLGIHPAQAPSATPAQSAQKNSASAVQIEPVESGDVALPAEFRVAIYENLIEQVTKRGKFQHVYRGGDRSANSAPDLVVLHTRVEGFKRGSQKQREVTTVVGATSIKVRVQAATRDGRLLVDRNVEGKVRFFGENRNATHDLSKKVAKLLSQSL